MHSTKSFMYTVLSKPNKTAFFALVIPVFEDSEPLRIL